MVNSFSCNYFYKNKKIKEYFKNGNTVCWRGLYVSISNVYLVSEGKYIYNSKSRYVRPEHDLFIEEDFDFKNIYILLPKAHAFNDLNELLYNKYITRIVNLINKITLCKKVIINDKLYIKYKLLDKYSQIRIVKCDKNVMV